MPKMKPERVLERIQIAVDAAREKKADGLEVLDLRGLSGITDFFVICEGGSKRQVKAIVDEIDARLRQERVRPGHLEGDRDAEWILMDYIDFVIHVFTRDKRAFYGLEKLWADAPRVDIVPGGAAAGTKRSRPARR